MQKRGRFYPITGYEGPEDAREGWVVNATPWSFVQELGWTPEPVWTCAENLVSTGFDPRVVQHLASHYTDYGFAAHTLGITRFVIAVIRLFFVCHCNDAFASACLMYV